MHLMNVQLIVQNAKPFFIMINFNFVNFYQHIIKKNDNYLIVIIFKF